MPLNPILDQTQADRQFQATFQKDCGYDDLCQSQLEVYPSLKLEKDGKFGFKLKYHKIVNNKKKLLPFHRCWLQYDSGSIQRVAFKCDCSE